MPIHGYTELYSYHNNHLFYDDASTVEIFSLSLHDALPISVPLRPRAPLLPHLAGDDRRCRRRPRLRARLPDRKSTRLNSSHSSISYAVFCLKKKKRLNNKTKIAHIKLHVTIPPHVPTGP